MQQKPTTCDNNGHKLRRVVLTSRKCVHKCISVLMQKGPPIHLYYLLAIVFVYPYGAYDTQRTGSHLKYIYVVHAPRKYNTHKRTPFACARAHLMYCNISCSCRVLTYYMLCLCSIIPTHDGGSCIARHAATRSARSGKEVTHITIGSSQHIYCTYTKHIYATIAWYTWKREHTCAYTEYIVFACVYVLYS